MTSTPVDARPVRPAPLTTLRICGVVTLVATVAQPLWAGLFVTGDVGMLLAHSIGGVVTFLGAVGYLIAGLVAWRRGHGRAYLLPAIVFNVAVLAQVGAGVSRVLWLHFPLGVVMAVGALQLITALPRRERKEPA